MAKMVHVWNSGAALVVLSPRMVGERVIPGARLVPNQATEVSVETYEEAAKTAPSSTWFAPGGFLRLVDAPGKKGAPKTVAPPAPAPVKAPANVSLDEGFEDGVGAPPSAPHGEEATEPDYGLLLALNVADSKAFIAEETDLDLLRGWVSRERRTRVLAALDSRISELS